MTVFCEVLCGEENKRIQDNKLDKIPEYGIYKTLSGDADFESLAKKEKDLENLLAENLSDLYIEDGQLMRIFQERARQEEPDLCALNKNGNLVLFELKRGEVQGDTTIQVMRYAQSWGQKSYYDLNEAYAKYQKE